MMLGGVGLLLATAALLLRPHPTAAGEVMTAAEAGAVRQAVLPKTGEDEFDKIPWLTSIWDARVKAAKEGKPILLWEMDGHPLGCG
jgi:hypothetical protein